MLVQVPSLGRNPRGSPDFLAYPVPRACMHVLDTGVPRRLGVARSASSFKAAQALGYSLTPGLRISFCRVTCMARLSQCPGYGHWLSHCCVAFVFRSGLCLGWGFRNPASPAWRRGWVCLGTGCVFAPPFPAGDCGVCGWAWVSARTPTVLVGVLERAFLCARSACTPQFAIGVCRVGVCAWAPVSAAPATPRGGVGVCMRLCARPARASAPPCWGCGAGGCAWAWVAAAPRLSSLGCWGLCVFVCVPRLNPAIPGSVVRCGRVCLAQISAVPRNSWLGYWGVCAFVRVPRLHPAIAGGVVCVCVGFGFVCSPVLLASCFGCWGAWPLVRAPSVSRHLLGGTPVAWGCAGVALGGVCPPPPLWVIFFWGGASWHVVSWLPGVGRWLSRSWVSWSPSPLPLSFRLRLRVCFFFPSPPQRGVCLRVLGYPFFRWAAALGLVLPVLAGWSSGAPAAGPHFGAVWPGGLAASCGVGGRFRGYGAFSCPPPLSFFGGVCLVLPLPSLGWRMHWSAFGVVNRVAVGACVLLGLPPSHGLGGLCTRLARWPFLLG